MSDKPKNPPRLISIHILLNSMDDIEKKKYINNVENKMKEYKDG